MAYVDAVDSFYQAVKARILTKNPNRLVMGLMEAQDWPSNNVKLEAFYLLTLAEAPAGGQHGTIANPVISELVQWVWMVKGSELAQNQRMRNRGDRFRTDQAMRGELMFGLYPNFTEKKTWTVDVNGLWIGASLDPQEYITWTRPTFMKKMSKDSGLVYGSVSVHITNMLEQISA